MKRLFLPVSAAVIVAAWILLLPFLRGCGPKPVRTVSWSGQGAGFLEWGPGPSLLWGVSAKDDTLDVWAWRGDGLVRVAGGRSPSCVSVVPLSESLFGFRVDPEKHGANWPFIVYDVNTSVEQKRFPAQENWSYGLGGVSANGRFAALTMRENADSSEHQGRYFRYRVGSLAPATWELCWVAELNEHGAGTVSRVAVSNDGRYIALGGWANGVALVDAKLSKVLWRKCPPHAISFGDVEFTPDAKILYAGGPEGYLYGMAVRTGDILTRWPVGSRITSVTVSPDGSKIACGAAGKVVVWEAATGRQILLLPHNGSVFTVAFSPSGRVLASHDGGSIRIWRVP